MSNNIYPTRMEPDDRREQIIRIASQHFLNKGYDKASMSGIANEARVTRALVYHYFPDKTALFEAVLQSEANALLNATELDPSLSTLDNIRNAIRAYLVHFSAASNSSHTINLRVQMNIEPVLVRQTIQANHAILAQRLIAVLKLEDDQLIHLGVRAWLDFVTALSQELATRSDINWDSAIEMCIHTLQAILPPTQNIS